ncbi:putative polyketide [Diaporthe ampelina]|uniref:Putative polyketide n=1 Tax=Diaporthe ampelina TaxID=1214573 RepID=A0A0G2F802_9PEZI|nr:putative polyketide [Diaporthe ampelina]
MEMSPSRRDSGYYDGSLEPIAIVGMAMWDAMVNRELKTAERVPASRFNIDAYHHPGAFTRPASITSPGGSFIDTPPEHFDPEFFGMEDDEALQTDPQHRRMLELVYECLESAGITKDAVVGTRTGVYVGNFSLDAVVKSCRHDYDRHAHATMSIDPGLVSSRISYWYDLKGPVFTINSGCTSVFFATDTACLALRAGDCDAAIIGGVNLLQSPEQSISIAKYGVLSPDSVPLPFDSGARGYLRAEGVGALYVKRLSDAIRDRDPIRGVIRCAHLNSNGAQPGLPMFSPNRVSIENMVRDIYKKAGLDPNETAYVEPQGIGLAFADVSEQIGIGSAMKATRRKDAPLLMGSLKGNFGHQEAGSGVFALIKAAMMTEAGVIPGLPNFKHYHPKVDPDGLNIKVQAETIPWPTGYATRRVGISSWGWSGTNGHILVEALDALYPGYQQGKTRDHADYDHSIERPLLITYSAHTRNALRKNIVKHQGLADKYYLADLAYTLNMRRTR